MAASLSGYSSFDPSFTYNFDHNVEFPKQDQGLRGRIKDISAYVSTHFQKWLPTIIQVACVVALVSLGFFPAYFLHLGAGADVAYAVARGAGAALKILTPCLFVPTLRMFHAKVHHYLPKLDNTTLIGKLFHNRMAFHRYLGEAFVATAVVHTAAHIFRSSVPLLAVEPITGIAMLAFSILPVVTIYALRSSANLLNKWEFTRGYYKQFLLPHQLGWWGLASAFAIHTRDFRLLPISAAFFGLFCIDRIWEWKQSRNVEVKSVEKIHDNMIIIEVDKPEGYSYETGQKTYIAYPPPSAFVNNLHPFTIASSPDENVIRFVISATGEWTRGLVDNLKNGAIIRLSPAFPSPLEAINNNKNRMFISSGSGIAMTLAHLHDQEDKTPIHIIHTSRKKEEFELLDRYAKDPKYNIQSVQYFDTSAAQDAKRLEPSKNDLIQNFEGNIYFCGNENLGKAIEKEVRKCSKSIFLREKFNF
jgi:ferredoxin-NADP reductase